MKQNDMRIKNFKLTILLCAIVITLILAGCTGGSYKMLNGNINVKDNIFSGSYNYFDGKYFKKLKFEENNIICFNFDEETEEGSVEVKLLDKNGKELINIAEKAKNIEIKIKESGIYSIQVIGTEHKGSFRVEWNLK